MGPTTAPGECVAPRTPTTAPGECMAQRTPTTVPGECMGPDHRAVAHPSGEPGLASSLPDWVWRTNVAFSQASGIVVAST